MADTGTINPARLCKSCDGAKRWYPTPISKLDDFFSPFIKKSTNVPNGYAVRKNLCYALQYLEYQAECLKQLSLSGVLLTMTYKQFVITGIGVVEGILYYLIRERQLLRTNEWELLRETVGQQTVVGSETFRADTHLKRKRPSPIEAEPTFERILRTAENKKVLGTGARFYAQAHHLRKLRNKVHLYVTANALDSDWNAFEFKELELIKAALITLITGQPFAATKGELRLFSYLQPWKALGEPTA